MSDSTNERGVQRDQQPQALKDTDTVRLDAAVASLGARLGKLESQIQFWKTMAAAAALVIVGLGAVTWYSVPRTAATIATEHAARVAEAEAERFVRVSGIEEVRQAAQQSLEDIQQKALSASTLVQSGNDVISALQERLMAADNAVDMLERRASDSWVKTLEDRIAAAEGTIIERTKSVEDAISSLMPLMEQRHNRARESAYLQWRLIQELATSGADLKQSARATEINVLSIQDWIEAYGRSRSLPADLIYHRPPMAMCVEAVLVDGVTGLLYAPAGFSDSLAAHDLSAWYDVDHRSLYNLLQGRLEWNDLDGRVVPSSKEP